MLHVQLISCSAVAELTSKISECFDRKVVVVVVDKIVCVVEFLIETRKGRNYFSAISTTIIPLSCSKKKAEKCDSLSVEDLLSYRHIQFFAYEHSVLC
jgi:hypothetical protein